MNRIKLLALLPLILLTGCGCSKQRIYVTSMITNKYDYTYTQVVSTGKTTAVITHRRYVFQFNEIKPYNKPVDCSTYKQYNVGDEYTFWIDDTEKEYFYPDSYETITVKDSDNE